MSREALNRLAANQNSLFTRRQAIAMGLSPKEIEGGARAGSWQRLYRGVYRMGGAPATEVQALHAAVLAGGPAAVASHRGAAWLWALLDEMRREIAGPQRAPGAGIVAYRRVAADIRPVLRRGVPSTDPLRTVMDLASVGDETAVEMALDRGIYRGLFTATAVEAELERRAGRGVHGVVLLRSCLGRRLERQGERPSPLEAAMDRLIARHGLPRPQRQYCLAGTRYRLDYAWPAARVLVEVDGYESHAGLGAFCHDRERQNALVLAGWTVLRFTWDDVRRRPAHVAEQIRRALAGDLAGAVSS